MLNNSITYKIGNSLYLNITNRCLNDCGFCIRRKAKNFNGEYTLWLEKEPTIEEIMKAIGDPAKYDQIVFCGYGEPLIRLDIVKEIAAELKLKIQNPCLPAGTAKSKQGTIIRLDTNGQANLFWGRNIVPELKELIDHVVVSLNAENAALYQEICSPHFGAKAYPAILDFIKECKKYIPQVEISVVGLDIINKKACQKIADQFGIPLRIRPYYEKKYVR